ncbi:MAG: small ribosomal subunit biogenesis GTPase RsgA [Gammaproteobacteria bacterium]|nr:small ribosomal subunit biogenesis GTPase RsgA [Gammaproteobacteria bacterium]
MSDRSRPGRVITRYGADMIVEDEDGQTHRCTTRRKLQDAVCGDYVQWQAEQTGNAVVVAIEKRQNVLTRPDLRGRPKPIAANIDQLAIVSAHLPAPNWEMVDRYLVAAELLPADALIVLNKCDLADTHPVDETILAEYRELGYQVLEVSSTREHGLDGLLAALKGKTSILVGLSGVGKSSLIKNLLPAQDIRIGEISDYSSKGKHTTTSATLYHLPDGGDLIDSPGVRDFTLGTVTPTELARGFREIADRAGECRFHNCTHVVEPGCAVKAAVEDGGISRRRYTNYRNILAAVNAV